MLSKTRCLFLIKRIKLICTDIQERYLIFVLFISALFNGLYEIAIIKEFTVPLHNIQTSTYLFFAFLHIFFGAGSYIAFRFFNPLIKKRNIRILLLLSGISIILSLLTCLRINIEFFVSVGIHIFFVCLVFTLFGIIYSLIIIYFIKNRSPDIGLVIAHSLIGLIFGFLLEPFLAVHLGVNAVCLILGIGLIFLYIGFPYFSILTLIVVALSLVFPIDENLEKLRIKKIVMSWKEDRQEFEENYSGIFNRWSPYTKLNIYLRKDGQKIIGARNYTLFWLRQKKEPKDEFVPFSFIAPEDKVLIIGAGAGRDADRLPADRKISRENTTMVEIDPLVVRYFRQEHPEYNDYIFNRVNIITADGRAVLDEMKEKNDVIVISAFRYARTNIWMLEKLKLYLFTFESIKRCFELLNKDGILMIHHSNPIFNTICASLKKLKVYFRVFQVPRPKRNKFIVYASRDRMKIDQIVNKLLTSNIGTEITDFKDAPMLTDDRPFINLIGPEKNLVIIALRKCLIFIFFLVLLILLLMRRKKNRQKIFYFFLIGNGFFLTQLFILTKFRSFFTHPLRTIIIVTLLFLSSVALGSILSRYIKIEYLKKKLWLHGSVVGLTLLYFYILVSHIPFSVSNYFIKLLASLAIILPMGVVCGFFYPIGLSVNRNENLGLALFFDGLGTCSALLLFYSICGLFGIFANFYPIAFCYLLAIVLVSLQKNP